MSKIKIVFVGLAVLLGLAACGGDGGAGGSTDGSRTVEVKALDTLRFEPSSVNVRKGEKVRFVVTNAGKIPHEFVLGDEETQMGHEQMSGQMDHMSAEGMATLALQPGETKEATVAFDEPGKILFGCHEPGHYKAGMVGAVTVG